MTRKRKPNPEAHPLTGKRPQDLSSAELQAQLVSDAVAGLTTPLPWFVAACDRMARLDRCTPEDAYQRVRREVSGLGGFMPNAPGS